MCSSLGMPWSGHRVQQASMLRSAWCKEEPTSLLEPRGFCCCCCCCCCCCSMTAARRWAATDARATASGAGCFCFCCNRGKLRQLMPQYHNVSALTQ